MQGKSLSIIKIPPVIHGSGGGTVLRAINGVSLSDPTTVRLGQQLNEAGNPAILLDDTEIPFGVANIYITGSGQTYIGDSPFNISPTSGLFNNIPKLGLAGGKPTLAFNIVDEGEISGDPWGTSSIIFRTENENVPLVNPPRFGDNIAGAIELHYASASGGSTPYVCAMEFWIGGITGYDNPILGILGQGDHFAGTRHHPSVESLFTLNVGVGWSTYPGFSSSTATLNIDANNEAINIWNLPITTNPLYWLTMNSSGEVSKSLVYLRYKESITPTTANDYNITGDYAVAIGGQGHTVTGSNSIVIGGTRNVASGNDSFGIGDNSAVIGGYQNQANAVDSVVIGGDDNIISVTGVNSVIMGGGQNSVTGWNSSTLATGVGTVDSKNSAIIATGESLVPCLISINADNSGILGGEFHTISGKSSVILGGYHNNTYSYAEIVLGQYNVPYIPVSATTWNVADRIFTIGNGTGVGTESNILTILKGGNVGIGVNIPTASIHLKAGTTVAGTAPIKFNAGSLLTVLELGALELIDNGTNGHLYITLNVSGTLTRIQIV